MILTSILFAEGIVVLEPKKIILNEKSEGSTSVNRAQGSLSVVFLYKCPTLPLLPPPTTGTG